MERYEKLWKKKKADIAEKIRKSANAPSAYSYAKELAEMELAENWSNGFTGKRMESKDSTEALFIELATVAEPVAAFLREKFNPHATVMITDVFVKVMADEVGMPLKEE